MLVAALLAGPAAGHAIAASAASAPGAAATPWTPDVRAATSFAQRRSGRVAFAVRTPTRAWQRGGDGRFPAASVVKAMLMVAYLSRTDVRHRPLKRSERDLLSRMIRRSQNPPANTLSDIVGADGLQRLARRAGMRHFVAVMGVWGRSRITASDQARFFQRIDRLLPRRHRVHAMVLLRTIVASQRWGIGRVRPPGWRLYFKGGWGSGTGLVDHQVALLQRGGRRISIAILTAGNPSHGYGKRTLRGIAARLLHGLPREAPVP